MLVPSIFGENLFDDWFNDFPFYSDKEMKDVEKKLYGGNAYDDNYEVGCRSIEDRKRIYSVMRQNKNAFMKLFSLFYYDLWD